MLLITECGPEVFKNAEAPSGGKKLFVVVSSDRGLCGGIHSSVTKQTSRLITEGNEDARVVVLGDKSKSQLIRLAPNNLLLTFNQIGKDVPTFADASVIADYITKSGAEFDSVCAFVVLVTYCFLHRVSRLMSCTTSSYPLLPTNPQ